MTIYKKILPLLAALVLLHAGTASAVTAADWKAGRIIDDEVFTNSGSMSVQEIQQFLNSKLGQCDTYGQQSVTYKYPFGSNTTVTTSRAVYADRKGNPKPSGQQIFTCLKDYYEIPKTSPDGQPAVNNYGRSIPPGAVSAAQLIRDASNAYNISPKVLLVTLQKEQGLISDDWPLNNQYLFAMGAQCPDGPGGAECDPNYASFSLQMREGARLFRSYLDNMTQPWWSFKKPYQTNNILWNVSYSGCGGSNVYIENKATAALYTYTPYQPNAAALNNLYGTGDGCSAYGNRNFWRMFNDWFGTTRLTGVRPSFESAYATSPCTPPVIPGGKIARLYNPDTKDYLLTASGLESCYAIRLGYIWDGIVFTTVTSSSPGASPVYRLGGFERHIYTSSSSVKANYQSLGYNDEGIAFYAYTSQSSDPTATPIHCLVKGESVVYTSSTGERVGLQQSGYSDVGTAFLLPLGTNSEIASRYVNNTHRRIYTSNETEKSSLPSYGFAKENADFKVDAQPGVNNSPIYRLRDPYGQYFYTSNRLERDIAVINYNYFSEGIAFYTPGNATLGQNTIYRLTNQRTGLRLFTTSAIERDSAVRNFGFTNEGDAWYGYAPN